MPSTKNNIPLILLIPTTLFLIVAYTSAFIGAAVGRLLAKGIGLMPLQRTFAALRNTSRRELKFIVVRIISTKNPHKSDRA
ncbi:MAG: hypothetical protein ACRBFS_07965 [Aureispira sp.]